MPKLSYWKSIALALILVAPIAAVGCGKTVGETIDDTTITTRVKTAMLNDPSVNALTVSGHLSMAMSTPRTFSRLSARVEAAARGPKYPNGVKIRADVTAARPISW